MTSDFYFTATSWFPENVHVKPHSKHIALVFPDFADIEKRTEAEIDNPHIKGTVVVHNFNLQEKKTIYFNKKISITVKWVKPQIVIELTHRKHGIGPVHLWWYILPLQKRPHWSNGEKYMEKINGIFSHKINLS